MQTFRYLPDVTTLQVDPERCVGCAACVTVCPHGVLAMSQAVEGLVETSTNLAVARLEADRCTFEQNADAGPDIYGCGTTFQFDGTRSNDPDGKISVYTQAKNPNPKPAMAPTLVASRQYRAPRIGGTNCMTPQKAISPMSTSMAEGPMTR